ncbi:helix-turn-helix domain-containing protein, partial [Sphaerisporangium sp. NPDC051017]
MHRRVTGALTLLAAVAESTRPRPVSDLARETGIGVSTVSRIAAELASSG